MTNRFFNLMTRPLSDHRAVVSPFEDFFNHAAMSLWPEATEAEKNFVLNVDVQETENHWALMVDIPGVKKEDLKIDVDGRALTISGKRESQMNEASDGETKWSRIERHHGSFLRTFSLPDHALTESIKAEYKDGVLKVMIPKKEVVSKKTIPITVE